MHRNTSNRKTIPTDIVPLLQPQLTDALRNNFKGMCSLKTQNTVEIWCVEDYQFSQVLPITFKILKHSPQLLTSFNMALNKDLPVLAAPTFFEGPYRISFLLLMVSAFNLGASPSMTNTSLIPIDVKKEIRKNRFLQQSKVISCRISEA